MFITQVVTKLSYFPKCCPDWTYILHTHKDKHTVHNNEIMGDGSSCVLSDDTARVSAARVQRCETTRGIHLAPRPLRGM